jgi:hypothetical protein
MNLFHSLLLLIGEIVLGLSVLVFVGAALAAYGEKFRRIDDKPRASFRRFSSVGLRGEQMIALPS